MVLQRPDTLCNELFLKITMFARLCPIMGSYITWVFDLKHENLLKKYPFFICIIIQLNYTVWKPSRPILSFCFCDKVWSKFSVERIIILIWLKFSVFQNVRQYGMICKRYRALIRDLNSGIKTWKVVFILPMYISSRSCVLRKEGTRIAAFLKELVGKFTY